MKAPVILLVEDEGLIATMLAKVLRTGGYEVLFARSGMEALILGQRHQGEIALLFCDILLPDLAGPAVATQIRELCPHVRTLFTSGYPVDALTEMDLLPPDTFLSENNFYIAKPFRPKELLQLIDRIISAPLAVASAGIAQGGATRVSAAY